MTVYPQTLSLTRTKNEPGGLLTSKFSASCRVIIPETEQINDIGS